MKLLLFLSGVKAVFVEAFHKMKIVIAIALVANGPTMVDAEPKFRVITVGTIHLIRFTPIPNDELELSVAKSQIWEIVAHHGSPIVYDADELKFLDETIIENRI